MSPVGPEPRAVGLRMVLHSCASGEPPRPLRVLVADDNVDAAESLGMLLEIAGCEVKVAYDGLDVLATVERFRPDACVLDAWMPRINGWDIARRLRAQARREPLLLIAFTGVQGQASVDKSAAAGFDHHLLKPANPSLILSHLAAFVSRAQTHLSIPIA